MDGRGLSEFYDSPMGQRTRRLILRRLRQFWPNPKGRRVLGYGFARPYLRAFLPEAERGIAAMPGVAGCGRRLAQGEMPHHPDRGRRAAFSRRLLRSRFWWCMAWRKREGLRPLLRQLWRVLAPEGRLLIVAPNRASLWAQMERSPFGHGRPFSRSELDAIAAGRDVRARAMAARALCAAHRQQGADQQRHGLGTVRRAIFSGAGRRAYRRSPKSLYAPATPVTARARTAASSRPPAPNN